MFVYGTLKRGQCRERCWPRAPRSVLPATIAGRLYDLGPYPALGPGEDKIVGELWQFHADDMPETLAVLDEVEGYSQLGDDYYRRIAVVCCVVGKNGQNDEEAIAFTYEFADLGQLADRSIVEPGADGLCRWPIVRDEDWHQHA
jgi:gamma-glutamylcyclotransferase (GGCT)/AIG2-like uncharacterized protein YtfP